MRTPSRDTPTIYYRILCTLLTEEGYDCAPWLAAAGINERILNSSDGVVGIAQLDRLISEIELGTGRKDWAFSLGKRITLTAHGSVGFVMVTSKTCGEMLALCARYYRLMNPLYALELDVAAGQQLACAQWRPSGPCSVRLRNFIEEIIAVSAYQQLLPFMAEDHGSMMEIRLAQPAPGHAARYAELSRAKVRFSDPDSPAVSVYFAARYLDAPNIFADEGSRLLAEEMCQRKINELDSTGGWREWVIRALRTADGVRPSQADLARLMHMSARTLERALSKEGTSYSELYERVGHERACEMLADGRLSISDISQRLGYSNIGAFSRAFKRRSGVTPSEFTQKAKKPENLD